MSKIKLFFVKGSCSLNPRIIINELGIDADFVALNPQDKTVDGGKDYFKINPKGSVPALMLENGEIITEGAIITQYLADTYKNKDLLPEYGTIKRIKVLEMVNYIATDLHKTCSPLFNSKVPEDVKNDVFRPALVGRLKFVDGVLSKNQYLTGDTFTIADSYLFVFLSWMDYVKLDISGFSNIQKFIKTVSQRPSIIKSLADEAR